MDLGSSKFDIGQKVWMTHVVTHSTFEACKKCGGAHTQISQWKDGTTSTVHCPTCNGSGQGYFATKTTRTHELWRTGVICSISLNLPQRWSNFGQPKQDRELTYEFRDVVWLGTGPSDRQGNYIAHEAQMFLTEAEALEAIAEDNRLEQEKAA